MKKEKLLWFVSTAFLMLLVIGCSNSGGNNSESSSGQSTTPAPTQQAQSQQSNKASEPKAEEQPQTISMMMPLYVDEPPTDENPAIQAMMKYTNSNLKLTWVPSSAYNAKVTTMIAANDLPQIMTILNHRDAGVLNAIRAGMFWELGPYIKDYPNLKSLNAQVYKNISIDGKIFGIFRSRPLARAGIVFRKDWMDRLNISEPTTVDELVQMMRDFTIKDPDGNGQNDTYGLTMAKNSPIGISGWNDFMAWYGGPVLWGEKDGQLLPDFMFDEYYKVLKLFKMLYDDKIINQDFAVVANANMKDLINQGKAGVYTGALDTYPASFVDLTKLNPKAELDVSANIAGSNGVKVAATSGYSGIMAIPKSSVKTEEELKKVLAFLDKLGDKEMQDLYTWGVEGVHYRNEGGKFEFTDFDRYGREVEPVIAQLKYDENLLAVKGDKPDIQAKVDMYIQRNNDPSILVNNLALPLISETQTLKGSELDKIVDDARVKFIMGAIDEAEFRRAVDHWLEQGGKDIIKEYNEQYALTK